MAAKRFRWTRRILLGLAVIIAAFLVIVALQPADFRISRSAEMKSPPPAVFAQVNDFHKWEAWSPWLKLDPNAKTTYEGSAAGTGAIFTWAGNSDVGEGRMTITDARPDELIRIKLEFLKPFAATSTAEFTFASKAEGTAVTWAMYGKRSFIEKGICLFMDMDKMVGGDFEKGLAQIKNVVEATSKSEAKLPWPPVATFSILGFDPDTGEVGGAVQSRVFSVGNGVLWAEAGVGAAATQAIIDVSYGPQALSLLEKDVAPEDIIKQILAADPDPQPQSWSKEGRQFAVINMKGQTATHTGPKASTWAGGKQGKFCTAQGNILAGEDVVKNMVDGFENATGHLSYRLLAALEGGQKAGGDKRGMQSAAMLIVKKDGGVWLHNDTVLRLQVDDNPEPIKELRRLVEKWRPQRTRGR